MIGIHPKGLIKPPPRGGSKSFSTCINRGARRKKWGTLELERESGWERKKKREEFWALKNECCL